ncbi:MAG: SDR family oxidoreductase [Alphaproteobacteria bacterium]|nr:SDR family oxidoreductase [Alphaproteobacteria bacterium]
MKNLFSVAGKNALVTGGSRGIGLMIAEGYVRNGVKTYISSRKAQVCDDVAARLSKIGTCISLPFDLGTMEGIAGLAAALKEREERLDILVNNAGATWGAPIDEFPEDGWDKVMDLNVKSIFFLTKELLPLLRKSGSAEDPARVINIGSIDGLHLNPLEHYPYSAAKAGVHHLTRALAGRLARENITVNAIAPGPFESKMMAETLRNFGDRIVESNPRGRIGTPEDVAGTAIYLASRAGAYTNGVILPVDGGIVGCS